MPQRWRIDFLLLGSAAVPSSAAGASTSPASVSGAKAPVVPIERRPYKIRAWVSVDPDSRIDVRGRDQLIADWRSLVRRFVGAPWVLEVATDAPSFTLRFYRAGGEPTRFGRYARRLWDGLLDREAISDQ